MGDLGHEGETNDAPDSNFIVEQEKLPENPPSYPRKGHSNCTIT